MKTQILQLEPHDDIISTRDKIGWGQAGRILLIWPQQVRILDRRLDLQLLLRHSDALNAQLALVTRDAVVRSQAHQLGIPVFRSVRQAQTTRWRRPRRYRQNLPFWKTHRFALSREHHEARTNLETMRTRAHPAIPAWSTHPGTRLGLFGFGVLAALAIAGVLLPSARVTLTPRLQTQSASFTIQASRDTEVIDLSGTIPAREISVSVEGRESRQTSGETQIPNRPASGRVRFTNLTGETVQVPAGTVVRALAPYNAWFATTRAGSVPPGQAGSVEIPIEAIRAGLGGNLPSESIRSIDGPLGLRLAVTNPFPTHGGSDFTTQAPSQQDRQELHAMLMDSLRATAVEEVALQLVSGDMILNRKPSLIAIHEEIFEPEEDSPANQLDLTLRVEFQVLVASAGDIQALVTSLLDASRPEGYKVQENSLQIETLDEPEFRTFAGAEFARWRIRARRTLIADLKTIEVVNLLLGSSPHQARERLGQQLALAGPAQVSLTPDWWPRLPILPFRIQLEENRTR